MGCSSSVPDRPDDDDIFPQPPPPRNHNCEEDSKDAVNARDDNDNQELEQRLWATILLDFSVQNKPNVHNLRWLYGMWNDRWNKLKDTGFDPALASCELEKRQFEWSNFLLKQSIHLLHPPNERDFGMFHSMWNTGLGAELEPALASGAVALLDARWLVSFALQHGENTPLSYRQNLPPQAFLSLEEVVTATTYKIQIVALSHMWLHPSHPDPKGTTLQLLARELQRRLQSDTNVSYVGKGLANTRMYPRIAVFWDWASLYQHPDPTNGVFRTQEETKLFREGLNALAALFSHPYVDFWQITRFPEGYPNGFDLPMGANMADYHHRGWTFAESNLMNLAKNGGHSVFNISIPRSDTHIYPYIKMRPPMLPQQFNENLKNTTFTNAKDDFPIVRDLYNNKFLLRMGQMTKMAYANLRWGDFEIRLLAEIIGSNIVPCLESISLEQNIFGAEGCRSLGRALLAHSFENAEATVSSVRDINIGKNALIGDAGMEAMSDSLLQIPKVLLREISVGVEGCRALAKATERATSTKLIFLHLNDNGDIGDDGVEILSELIVERLENINLDNCNVSDKGCRALGDAAMRLPKDSPLERVSLRNRNNLITKDANPDLIRLLHKCPHMKSLHVHVYKSELDLELEEAIKAMRLREGCVSRVARQKIPSRRTFPHNVTSEPHLSQS